MMKLKKYLSWCCYFGFARLLPKSRTKKSFTKWMRVACAKGFCSHVGSNVNIERMASFSSRISIGDNSGIGINCVLQGEVHIGNNVMMGPQVWIYTRNHRHDRIDIPMIDQGFEEERQVIIDDDVWIGSRVTILPGVCIGKGVIIGTGSVVTKSVPPYSIVAGNPAVIVKNRGLDKVVRCNEE